MMESMHDKRRREKEMIWGPQEVRGGS